MPKPLIKSAIAIGLVAASVYFVWSRQQPNAVMLSHPTIKTVQVQELPFSLDIFETVFWEPADTDSLRELISESPELVHNKHILEIGTGSGLISLCCKQYGAETVTATDINPTAVACAQTNAKHAGLAIDVRLVNKQTPSAYSAVTNEKFDLIVSNPPWEDGKPTADQDYALYDPSFQLLTSIVAEAHEHLRPGGKILLAYGCVDAIRNVYDLADEHGYEVILFDERDFESCPPVFLPGMLLGLTPRSKSPTAQKQP